MAKATAKKKAKAKVKKSVAEGIAHIPRLLTIRSSQLRTVMATRCRGLQPEDLVFGGVAKARRLPLRLLLRMRAVRHRSTG